MLIFLYPCERPCFLSVSSQPCPRPQAGLVPPHKVRTLASGWAALHRTGPVPGPSVRAQGEAEASRAVADLEQAIRTQEGISFASSHVVDRIQVVVNCNVAQLLPSLQSPPPPQEYNTRHQNQHQDGQDAGDGEGGGGGLGGLAQSGLETGLERELTARTHETLWALAHRPSEVGKAGATVLTRVNATGIGAHAAVLAGVPQGAGAGVVVHTVLAGSGILAGGRGAVVNVDLAVGASEACLTAAQDALAEVQTVTTCRREKYSVQHPRDQERPFV